MARNKKPREEAKTDGWMATYSDLVTLLFCFFVLLYAQSSPDESKIQYIFSVFQTGGEYINQIVDESLPNSTEGDASPATSDEDGEQVGESTSSNTEASGAQESEFEQLFNMIAVAVDSSDFSQAVEVVGTSSQIRIKFDNDVLFDSDSSTLKESGMRALSVIIPSMSVLRNCIASVQVQGHTADINDINQTSPVNDWDLSSLRASAVIKYMDYRRTVQSEKFLSEGYAQYRPIASNQTDAGRAENRRVEILLIKDNTAENSELFDDIMKYDLNQVLWEVDKDGNPIYTDIASTDDIINQIVESIKDNHKQAEEGETLPEDEQTGPSIGTDMINIPESEFVLTDAEGNVIEPGETAEVVDDSEQTDELTEEEALE